jgi:hypothetical protein
MASMSSRDVVSTRTVRHDRRTTQIVTLRAAPGSGLGRVNDGAVPRPVTDIGGTPVRRTALALAAALSVVALAGCGDDTGDSADTDVVLPPPPTTDAVPGQSELPNADW